MRTKETYGAEGKKSDGGRRAEITEGQRGRTGATRQKIYREHGAATVRISRTRNITIRDLNSVAINASLLSRRDRTRTKIARSA